MFGGCGGVKRKCLQLLFEETTRPGMTASRGSYFDVLLQFVRLEGFKSFSSAEVWAITQAAKRRRRLPELELAAKMSSSR